MDASEAEINCGTPPTGRVEQEDGSLKVTSVNTSFSRDFTEYENDEFATNAVSARNPKAQIDLEGEIITQTGLADLHPGVSLDSISYTLANFAATNRGFDPSDGCIYLESADDSANENDPPTTQMTFQHRPFIVIPVS